VKVGSTGAGRVYGGTGGLGCGSFRHTRAPAPLPPRGTRRKGHLASRGAGTGAGRRMGLLISLAHRDLRHLRRPLPRSHPRPRGSWTSPATSRSPRPRLSRMGGTTIPIPALLAGLPTGLTESIRRIGPAGPPGCIQAKKPAVTPTSGAAPLSRSCAEGEADRSRTDVIVERGRAGTTGSGPRHGEDLLFCRGSRTISRPTRPGRVPPASWERGEGRPCRREGRPSLCGLQPLPAPAAVRRRHPVFLT